VTVWSGAWRKGEGNGSSFIGQNSPPPAGHRWGGFRDKPPHPPNFVRQQSGPNFARKQPDPALQPAGRLILFTPARWARQRRWLLLRAVPDRRGTRRAISKKEGMNQKKTKNSGGSLTTANLRVQAQCYRQTKLGGRPKLRGAHRLERSRAVWAAVSVSEATAGRPPQRGGAGAPAKKKRAAKAGPTASEGLDGHTDGRNMLNEKNSWAGKKGLFIPPKAALCSKWGRSPPWWAVTWRRFKERVFARGVARFHRTLPSSPKVVNALSLGLQTSDRETQGACSPRS